MPAAPARLRPLLLLVAAVATVAAALGIGVRALEGAHVAVDEEQYVLSATSLAEDGDLDIGDEIADQRWRAFADVAPHVETEPRPDGTQISPHDPLLPILLAVPVGLAGWVGAKIALALVAGAVAALTLWLAVRRFGVRPATAATGVAVAAASMPLAVYGQQIYPELPAALVTLLGVLALTGPVRDRELVLLGAVVTVLPWLSVKYALVALALAAVGAARWWRAGSRAPVAVLGSGLVAMGALYLVVHRAVWGGWTPYASGDHFTATGEFAVVGVDPDYVERAQRIVGLLLDREFGLVPWQPAWLLIVPGVAALLAVRVPGRAALAWPIAAGWFVATFVAFTMHGFWSPGRQVVVVLPLAVVATVAWLDGGAAWLRRTALVLGLVGVAGYVVFLVQGWLRQTTWVVHFVDSDVPLYRLLHPVLTDWRREYLPSHFVWMAAVAALAGLAFADARRRDAARRDPERRETALTPPGAAR